jgi:hypothetical protein
MLSSMINMVVSPASIRRLMRIRLQCFVRQVGPDNSEFNLPTFGPVLFKVVGVYRYASGVAIAIFGEFGSNKKEGWVLKRHQFCRRRSGFCAPKILGVFDRPRRMILLQIRAVDRVL